MVPPPPYYRRDDTLFTERSPACCEHRRARHCKRCNSRSQSRSKSGGRAPQVKNPFASITPQYNELTPTSNNNFNDMQMMLEEKALLERQVDEYRQTLESQSQLIATLQRVTQSHVKKRESKQGSLWDYSTMPAQHQFQTINFQERHNTSPLLINSGEEQIA